ncbi:hypothetical protein ANCDUO_10689 [Ancylostoma duodenale]|uniref:Uncharacterized protein n=1 Tax=Ancylostoma duodenale TaxID=51022 RepID=A0A0C2CQP1_9BILA|nr:hypothetical protein ANCDUO_10689 [Ancylostoma duodenale]
MSHYKFHNALSSKSITISEMDEYLANLSIFMNEKKPTTSCLENNLTLTLDGLHRQVDTAATIRVDWAHMKGDPAFTFGTSEEQVIIVNRILRAVSVAKEKINELQKAEKNVYEAEVHDKTELYKRGAYTLQNRLQEQQQDIHALTLQVRELESKAQAKETDNEEMNDTKENTTASKRMQLTGAQEQVECEKRRVQQVYSNCDNKYEQRHGEQEERSDYERGTEECHLRQRRCWYCERIRGTIVEDLMPDDGGHHRALCNVPNAGNTLRRRIVDIRRQLNG